MGLLCLMISQYSEIFCDTEVFGLVLLPNANDGQDGKHHRDYNPDRGHHGKPGLVIVTKHPIPCQDGAKELDNSHAQQGAHRVEHGE